jgi:hypothetical protein
MNHRFAYAILEITLIYKNGILYANADLQRDKAVGADLWTVFQQPDQRRDATMQAVRKMVDQKQVCVLLTRLGFGSHGNCEVLSSSEAEGAAPWHQMLQMALNSGSQHAGVCT